jgi:hypothetical protein
MNYIENKANSIQKIWKHIAAIGAWIGTVAGSILIPLPEWGDNVQHSSQIKFILFIATVIAGFSLVLTYNLKNKLAWMIISISFFFILIGSYYMYNQNIDKRTMKYYDSTIVIGDELKDPHNFESKKEQLNLDKNELLKTVGGDPTKLWTEQSINKNKDILVVILALNYCLFAIFLVSFINTVTLYTSKNV